MNKKCVVSLCIALWCVTITIGPVFGSEEECDFPAIFNFGDSNSDTGGLASAFPAFLNPPYGDTFFGEPSGRFSDGRLIIDFIGKSEKRLRLTPKEEDFKKALYTFDIGQNDLGQGFFGNMSIQEVNATAPDIVNTFSNNFKNIYNISGGKSFWIHNTGPIGCLPYILENFQSAERDEVGCAKPFNEVAQYFNHVLKQAVAQLRNDFPSASITYVDVYSAKYSLFTHPEKYGFEQPLVACCGYGGKYNYSVGCGGTTTTVNGTQITVGSCRRPFVKVNWDGIHYTEAANKHVFDKISTGAFSHPPRPLKRACYNSY
ncbi:esterase-like isoform X2 [Humulus lupulus]|uniref:esterase-like isoform X2 n=1 Tax=Humulus lupulus TaxID=3486 RepID=UPI002B414280|nr:esterase-like isoform X2 [Humulus lupulus]